MLLFVLIACRNDADLCPEVQIDGDEDLEEAVQGFLERSGVECLLSVSMGDKTELVREEDGYRVSVERHQDLYGELCRLLIEEGRLDWADSERWVGVFEHWQESEEERFMRACEQGPTVERLVRQAESACGLVPSEEYLYLQEIVFPGRALVSSGDFGGPRRGWTQSPDAEYVSDGVVSYLASSHALQISRPDDQEIILLPDHVSTPRRVQGDAQSLWVWSGANFQRLERSTGTWTDLDLTVFSGSWVHGDRFVAVSDGGLRITEILTGEISYLDPVDGRIWDGWGDQRNPNGFYVRVQERTGALRDMRLDWFDLETGEHREIWSARTAWGVPQVRFSGQLSNGKLIGTLPVTDALNLVVAMDPDTLAIEVSEVGCAQEITVYDGFVTVQGPEALYTLQ